MNYLGHAYLSFGDSEVLTGNMIGDYVKGKLAEANYPPQIWKGIILHRKIDEFADNHPATRRSKLFFRTDYGLYSGAIMDTLYDHFLANDPKIFASDKDLLDFSKKIYNQLDSHAINFPETFRQYYPHMVAHNWLYGYRAVKTMERSLTGLARRAKHMPPPQKAYELFIAHYYQLNQSYFELIDDMVPFVKNELNK